MIDIKNFIIEKIKEVNPSIDLRTGSVFRDIVVNPLSSALADYTRTHESFLQREAVTDLTSLAESELDAVASNFLIERSQGSYSVGNIKLYFSEPQAISMPAGTVFTTTTGLTFQTLATFSLSKFQMEQNIADFPNYDTGNIPLRALLPGIDHNIPEGTVLTFSSNVNITPVRVIATAGFSGGVAHESNDSLFRRLKDTVHNKSLASPYAIKAKIIDNYDDVVNVKIAGAGHPLMIRDLTSLVSDAATYKSEDFYLVYSGQHTGNYDKKHEAYYHYFVDPIIGSFPTMPAISGWTIGGNEFSTAHYQDIYMSSDSAYMEENDQAMINESFDELASPDPKNPQEALSLLMSNNKWHVHDGVSPSNDIFYVDEVNVEGGILRMGKHIDPDAQDKMLYIPYSQLAVLNDLATSKVPGTTEQLEVQLSGMVSADQFNNTAPIFHREIDQHTGVQIDFTFETTDESPNGEMAYATVFRNSEIYQPQDGYGLAWRKQPDYLVRMANNTHTAADIARFTEEYGSAPTVFGPALATAENSALWKYNVYLVDNDILQEEVWIGSEQLWDQTSGKNQFLQSGKVWIEAEQTYNVRINIYSNLATEAWIYNSGVIPAVPYLPGTGVINRGATKPEYVPVSSALITTDRTGRDTLYSYKSHFGLAVAQTRNYEWYFDDLSITSFVSKSPMHLFRFNYADTDIPLSSAFEVNYYGVGYDPNAYAEESPNSGHSQTMAKIWNSTDSAWETIGTHLYTIDDDPTNQLITNQFADIDDYTGDGYINIAALAYNYGASFPNDLSHGLRSYYIEMNNISADQVHRGNAMDVYVQDPTNILKGSTSQVLTSNILLVHNMPNIPNHVHEILELREGISKVAYDTSSYTITNLSAGNSYSADAQYSISFAGDDMSGTLVEVVYRYWSSGDAVATLLTQDDVRFPLADNKVKVMPPTVMNITSLIYSGGLPVIDMKNAIAGYINNLTTTQFDKSDLINFMYDQGANYVDTTIEITIREYDTEATRTTRKMTSSRYNLRTDTISYFYTNEDELSGVVQI